MARYMRPIIVHGIARQRAIDTLADQLESDDRSRGARNDTEQRKTMSRRKKLILTQPVKEGLKAIKVQLDARTIITLASMKMFEFWKQRYPKARVIG
jgi:hypothetical protein